MLRAIIFDFDGVIVDSEPLHYSAFKHVLAEKNIGLTESQYYTDYIGMDDKGCFSTVLKNHGHRTSRNDITTLINKKSAYFDQHIKSNLHLFSGVASFIRTVSKQWPLAIVSGALRNEIDLILKEARLHQFFDTIISAENVEKGKPDPEGFLKGLESLNQSINTLTARPNNCLVIEDSIPGVYGAQAAGMRCLAVTNTHPPEQLAHADAITSSLDNYAIDSLVEKLWAK